MGRREDSIAARRAASENQGRWRVFLESDAARFVTGTVLVIDGGYSVY